jgi:hypothetical protein
VEDATRGGADDVGQLGGRGRNKRGRVDDARQSSGGGNKEREGWRTQGNWVVDDTKRGEGWTLRTQSMANNMMRGGSDTGRHVCNCLPPYTIDMLLDNSMPLFILHLKL